MVISLKDLIMRHLEDLTVNIFEYFLGIITSLRQPIIQGRIITPQQHHQIKVPNRKEITTMEVKQQPTLINFIVLINEIDEFVVVKFRHTEFLVERGVELVSCDELAYR
jgi:hypothetical protein